RLDFGPPPTGSPSSRRSPVTPPVRAKQSGMVSRKVSQNDSPIASRKCPKKERCCDTSLKAVGVSHDKVAPQVGIAKHSKRDSRATEAANERRATRPRVSDRTRNRTID